MKALGCVSVQRSKGLGSISPERCKPQDGSQTNIASGEKDPKAFACSTQCRWSLYLAVQQLMTLAGQVVLLQNELHEHGRESLYGLSVSELLLWMRLFAVCLAAFGWMRSKTRQVITFNFPYSLRTTSRIAVSVAIP